MVGNDPKAAPDMYFFAHDKIGVYAEMGILSPITDIIPAEELDAIWITRSKRRLIRERSISFLSIMRPYFLCITVST
mgnify:CR=1 FL=1